MKRLLFFLSVFILVSVNTYGQDTYIGKIVLDRNPCPPSEYPCLPGVVLWLKSVSADYVLTIRSNWIWSDRMTVNGVEYLVNDEVEIKGTVRADTDMHSEEYLSLEIETIKKLSSSINSSSFNKNKVHYNNASQIIVIDEDLQNQSIVFELIDMQGKVILQKTGVNNSISIENLPNGVYVYRLLENNQIICWGKIIK
jgi:hypothetical protein